MTMTVNASAFAGFGVQGLDVRGENVFVGTVETDLVEHLQGMFCDLLYL